MNYNHRYAILLDGAFVIRKLQKESQDRSYFPSADDIITHCKKIQTHHLLTQLELLRIYFYHAKPFAGEASHPISREVKKYAETPIYSQHLGLLDTLELKPNVAIRLGETDFNDWRLGLRSMKDICKNPRSIEARDLVPNIVQKGVDLRIGLDIARLSLKKLVGSIVLVTGDSDLIPAMKFARREGTRIYLDYMNHGIKRELKAHADILL